MAKCIARVLAAAACLVGAAAFGTGEIKSTITDISPSRGSVEVRLFDTHSLALHLAVFAAKPSFIVSTFACVARVLHTLPYLQGGTRLTIKGTGFNAAGLSA